MNISKREQRVLHALARGGCIRHTRNGPHIVGADCLTREGYRLDDFDLQLFARLRHRGLITSANGNPYRISARGLVAVRAQPDNRT